MADYGGPCPYCDVQVDERHLTGCDVGLCRAHGEQLSFCTGNGAHDSTVWTGAMPGQMEAIERMWFVKRVDGGPWVECSFDDPDARPDINRVRAELSWNPETECFIG